MLDNQNFLHKNESFKNDYFLPERNQDPYDFRNLKKREEKEREYANNEFPILFDKYFENRETQELNFFKDEKLMKENGMLNIKYFYSVGNKNLNNINININNNNNNI